MYRGQIGLKVKIPQSGSVLEHTVYFKSHLLAKHSMNEGESSTDLEWYSI